MLTPKLTPYLAQEKLRKDPGGAAVSEQKAAPCHPGEILEKQQGARAATA